MFFEEGVIRCMDYPRKPQALNPIKNIWDVVKRLVISRPFSASPEPCGIYNLGFQMRDICSHKLSSCPSVLPV